jgi:hypothetical protein
VPHGVQQATTDETTIRAWWTAAPHANLGIALGPATPVPGAAQHGGGLFVVDVDPKAGGDRVLAGLVRELGGLGPTLHAHTGSGGDHYFFAHPLAGRIVGAAHRLGRGLDVQARGQYVVAPPSRHFSGGVYVWEAEDAVPLDAPTWLLERVLHREPSAPAPGDASQGGRPRRVAHGAARAPFTGARPVDVERRAVAYLAELPPAIEGQGGDRQTVRAAHQLVRGFGLPPARALALLAEHWNPRCEPPWTREALARKVDYVDRTSASPAGFLLGAS